MEKSLPQLPGPLLEARRVLEGPLSPPFFLALFSLFSVVLFLVHYLFENFFLGHFLLITWGVFIFSAAFEGLIRPRLLQCPGCAHQLPFDHWRVSGKMILFDYECTNCERALQGSLSFRLPLPEWSIELLGPQAGQPCSHCSAFILDEEIFNGQCPACLESVANSTATPPPTTPSPDQGLSCPFCRKGGAVERVGRTVWRLFETPVRSDLFFCVDCQEHFVHRQSIDGGSPLGRWLPHRRIHLSPIELEHIKKVHQLQGNCPRCMKGGATRLRGSPISPEAEEIYQCAHCHLITQLNLEHLSLLPLHFIQCQSCGRNVLREGTPLESFTHCSHCSDELQPWIPEGITLPWSHRDQTATRGIPCHQCKFEPEVPLLTSRMVKDEKIDISDLHLFDFSSDWVVARCPMCQATCRYSLHLPVAVSPTSCQVKDFTIPDKKEIAQIDLLLKRLSSDAPGDPRG